MFQIKSPSKSLARNDFGRVFIQGAPGQLGCCAEFLGCITMAGINQTRDEPITIKCASATKVGKFDTVQRIPGEKGDVTFDLSEYMPLDDFGELYRMFDNDCPVTLHVHMGQCTNPSDFTQFSKGLVFKDVLFNSFSTDDLIINDSANRNIINQTISGSASEFYMTLYDIKFQAAAVIPSNGTTIQEVLLVASDDCAGACTFCNCELQDCEKSFVSIDDTFVGAATVDRFVYTVTESGGITRWDYDDAVSQVVNTLSLPIVQLDTGDTITAIELKCDTYELLIGTNNGQLYEYDLRTRRQSSLNDFSAAGTISQIAANDYGYLVGFNSGDIYYSNDGLTWDGTAITGSVTALFLYNTSNWLAASASGRFFYTNDSGNNYVASIANIINGEPVNKFAASSAEILYAISDTRFHVSFDAACTWNTIDLSAQLTSLTDIMICASDPFTVYLAGVTASGDTCVLTWDAGV